MITIPDHQEGLYQFAVGFNIVIMELSTVVMRKNLKKNDIIILFTRKERCVAIRFLAYFTEMSLLYFILYDFDMSLLNVVNFSLAGMSITVWRKTTSLNTVDLQQNDHFLPALSQTNLCMSSLVLIKSMITLYHIDLYMLHYLQPLLVFI